MVGKKDIRVKQRGGIIKEVRRVAEEEEGEVVGEERRTHTLTRTRARAHTLSHTLARERCHGGQTLLHVGLL